jgi:hypothetical protein
MLDYELLLRKYVYYTCSRMLAWLLGRFFCSSCCLPFRHQRISIPYLMTTNIRRSNCRVRKVWTSGDKANMEYWNSLIYMYGKMRQRVTCTMDNNLRVIYIVYPWKDEMEEFHNFSLIFQSSLRVLGSSSLQGMLFNSYVTATGLNITVQIFHLCCFTRGDVQSSAD